MKIAIVDDEISILCDLKRNIEKYYKNKVELDLFTSTKELNKLIANANFDYDVLIIDIQLKEENGIDFAYMIQQKFSNIKILFLTGYNDKYSQKIFIRTNPFGYITKPVDYSILFYHLSRIMNDTDEFEILRLRSNKTDIELNLKKIMYFESDKRKIIIHSVNGSVDTYAKMKTISEQLPNRFIETHKSYIVNLDYIKLIEKQTVILYNGKSIPISKRCYKSVRENYFRYNGGIEI